jgi:hypothetical protein
MAIILKWKGSKMTITLEQSTQWQHDNAASYIAALRAELGDSVNNGVLDAMEQLYRAGWNDCYRHVKLNAAIDQSIHCHSETHGHDYVSVCRDCEIW